jgi:protein phosphatase
MASTKSDEASRGVLVSVASLTDVGRVRNGNEDALVIADLIETEIITSSVDLITRRVGMDGVLLAVADGIGGAQAGEVASRMAVEQLADTLMATAGALPPSVWLREGLESVNRYIRSASHENIEYAGMGATVTAAVIHGEQAIIGQVGDSRAYAMSSRRRSHPLPRQYATRVLSSAPGLSFRLVSGAPAGLQEGCLAASNT